MNPNNPKIEIQQMEHAAKMAEGESQLYGIRVEASRRRRKAERKLILQVATAMFGPSMNDEQKKTLDNFLAAHKEESIAQEHMEGLELHKLNSNTQTLQAAVTLMKEAQQGPPPGSLAGTKRVILPR